jgi:cold shock CspA family protein
LSDEEREVIERIGILDATEGEYAYTAQPYTFVWRPDLTVHKIYDGWFFVGRPTLEELRGDLREIMRSRSDYSYEAYDTPEARSIRIPQQEWADRAPPLGENDLPVARGVVRWFDVDAGVGTIESEVSDDGVFFNFATIPGEGYRTLRPDTPVRFEVVESEAGLTARNVQKREET